MEPLNPKPSCPAEPRQQEAEIAQEGIWKQIKKVTGFSAMAERIKHHQIQRKHQRMLDTFDIKPFKNEPPCDLYFSESEIMAQKQHMEATRKNSRVSLNHLASEALQKCIRQAESSGKKLSPEEMETLVYQIYKERRPDYLVPLYHKQCLTMAVAMESIKREHADLGVRIIRRDASGKWQPEERLDQLPEEQIPNSGYSIIPVSDRVDRQAVRARISLNFTPKCAVQVVDLLCKVTGNTSEFSDIVDRCKIFSPLQLGLRVDSAIIYLKYNPDKARRLALYIARQLDGVLISHVPAGMHELHAGVNYGELVRSGHVSYGLYLGGSIARAISLVLEQSFDLESALTSSLVVAELDPECPAYRHKPTD